MNEHEKFEPPFAARIRADPGTRLLCTAAVIYLQSVLMTWTLRQRYEFRGSVAMPPGLSSF
jgi:hypothetical protein